MLILSTPTVSIRRVFAPVVQLRANWAADWITFPELKLTGMRRVARGGEVSTAELARPYGMVKWPWEAGNASYRGPLIVPAGTWCRIGLAGEGQYVPQFVGRLETAARDPQGDASHGSAGVQTWRAYGAERLLQKIHVCQSVWQVNWKESDYTQQLHWMPAMNGRTDQALPGRGNRSEEPGEHGVYVYGGEKLWTHRDYVDYLLHYAVDESDAGGPAWVLDGQVDILERLTETIEWRTTQTVAEMLSELIPRRLGIDWRVEPTAAGFAVVVFALSHEAYQFGDAWMPRNPRELRMATGAARAIRTSRIVFSEEQSYQTIRMLGARVVVCGTLAGYSIDVETLAFPTLGTLIAGWTDEEETAYKTAVEAAEFFSDDRDWNADRFRDVFQFLHLDPDADLNALGMTPTIGADDELTATGRWQNVVRTTLDWLPLRIGADYTADADPIEDQELSDDAEFLPPAVYLRRYAAGEEIAGGIVDTPAHDVYIGADGAGFTIEAARNTLGVRMLGLANWELADNHWDDPPDGVEPLYDWDTAVATLAWETDLRFGFQWSADGATPSGGVLEVEVPDAQLWVLAPDTIVDVDEHGRLLRGPTEMTALRRDDDRLLFALAGVLARYQEDRCRAELIATGLLPWAGLLGTILRSVEEGGAVHEMASVVTAIQWSVDGGGGTTEISAGGAR